MVRKSKSSFVCLSEDGVPLKTFNLGLHPYADRDLRSILAYIDRDSPFNANLVEDRIEKTLWSIKEQPFANPTGLVNGTRRAYVHKTKYRIIYVIRSTQIIVLRILHSARLLPVRQLKILVGAKNLTVVAYAWKNPEKVT